MRLQFATLFLGASLTCHVLNGQQPQNPSPENPADANGSLPHIEAPTLGGFQLWSDQLLFHDWRIQTNVITGHSRLLDDRNIRRGWGSFEQCQTQLERRKRKLELPPMKGKVVILLHGLGRSRGSLSKLATYLRQQSDYQVLNMSYASTRADIGRHAEALASVVRHLPDAEEINFVAHSMGNLVIRHYLADREETDETTPPSHVHRIVMLGPPNQGAELANRFRNLQAFQLLSGAGGRQIANWSTVADKLAIPSCEFAIIAGGTGDQRGYNPLIKGDDDMVVAVDETKLAGARDFVVVPCWHTIMMNRPLVHQYVLSFLQQGHFRSADERSPIPSSTTGRRDLSR